MRAALAFDSGPREPAGAGPGNRPASVKFSSSCFGGAPARLTYVVEKIGALGAIRPPSRSMRSWWWKTTVFVPGRTAGRLLSEALTPACPAELRDRSDGSAILAGRISGTRLVGFSRGRVSGTGSATGGSGVVTGWGNGCLCPPGAHRGRPPDAPTGRYRQGLAAAACAAVDNHRPARPKAVARHNRGFAHHA